MCGKTFYVGTPTGYLVNTDQLLTAIERVNRKLPDFVDKVVVSEHPLDSESSESTIDIYTKLRPVKPVNDKIVRKFNLGKEDEKRAKQFVDHVIMVIQLANN